ncbi:SDR family NAD(P)-dependent oxidoreductase [Microlunatus soli]|uniref:NAD(P)-dependent dehydrogenase, short-chain alcohol dehydrogenase family n=1 Tax=Microlunatus soli TaxID=630515 RepID=A0A1H1W467_9ACTN|nr:SDR family NAD(P)-dependent oxidoreductase [Microlunatus soli]SDS92088.1 NAD(P)-dependent dehydrogenase, short-chain alcohol dehydrogenase family [Microlunatus soli]
MTDSKIILITGANKGIGYETARALGAAGHTVLMGARNPGRGRTAADTLRATGLDVRYLPLDLTDEKTITAASELIRDEYGRLDILINNAVTTVDLGRTPEEVSRDDLRTAYETNVFGPVSLINSLIPLLRNGTRPLIGNVSSGLGTFTFLTDPTSEYAQYRTLLTYNSSKAALNAVTVIYATRLAADGIRVNALSPGFVATDLNNNTGTDSPADGGRRIAEQVLAEDELTGVFRRETGGGYPW